MRTPSFLLLSLGAISLASPALAQSTGGDMGGMPGGMAGQGSMTGSSTPDAYPGAGGTVPMGTTVRDGSSDDSTAPAGTHGRKHHKSKTTQGQTDQQQPPAQTGSPDSTATAPPSQANAGTPN